MAFIEGSGFLLEHRAQRHGVHPDALGAETHRVVAGQLLESGLGQVVDQVLFRGDGAARHGTHQDDPMILSRLQAGPQPVEDPAGGQ